MNEQPDNKIAVVTGGGSGIGRATAAKLADTGTKVICADIDEAKGAETVDQILASGGSAEFQKLDITDDDSISDFAERVMAGQPAPDVLVNAVGGCYNVLFMNADPNDWSREVDLNFLGPVKLTRAFLGPMTEAPVPLPGVGRACGAISFRLPHMCSRLPSGRGLYHGCTSH